MKQSAGDTALAESVARLDGFKRKLKTYLSSTSSAIILVLPASNIFTKFRRGNPLPGR